MKELNPIDVHNDVFQVVRVYENADHDLEVVYEIDLTGDDDPITIIDTARYNKPDYKYNCE